MPKPVGRPAQAKTPKEFFASTRAQELWKKGKENAETAPSFGEYDDGIYRAKVVKASTGRAQTSGRWQHTFAFKFIDGAYKGQSCYDYKGLEHEVSIGILIQTLKKLGFDIEDLDQIVDIDKKIEKSGVIVDIRLKTNGEYQNVLVLKKVEGDDADNTDEEETNDDEETDDDDDSAETEDSDSDTKDTAKDTEEDDDADEDDTEDDEDEEEEKPKSKKVAPKSEKDNEDEEEDDEEEEESEKDEEEKVTLEPGMRLKVTYKGKEVKVKLIKIVDEKKDGTGTAKVKLPNGEKVLIDVPDDIVDILE